MNDLKGRLAEAMVRIPVFVAVDPVLSPGSMENEMRRINRRILIPSMLFLYGCDSGHPIADTAAARVPVSGRVVAGRRPVPGVIVTFEPKFEWNPDLPKPSAVTEADGSFEIGTVMTGDGAPTGEYLVSIASSAAENGIVLDPQFEDAAKSGLKASVGGKPMRLPDFVVKKGSSGRSASVK